MSVTKEQRAQALAELAHRAAPPQRGVWVQVASPEQRPSLREDTGVRRQLHEVIRAWWRQPTPDTPEHRRACWANAALAVEVEADEWPELRASRDQQFRHCAEQAGVLGRRSERESDVREVSA